MSPHSYFIGRSWEMDIPEPWTGADAEGCLEITQREGVGALHVSSWQKVQGPALLSEALADIRRRCPGEEAELVPCGEFVGYRAAHIDVANEEFWCTWFLVAGNVLLLVTYHCTEGDESLEVEAAGELLKTLRLRR